MSTADRSGTTTSDEIAYARPADLAAVRAFVRTAAVALGLPASRADLLTVAVSELATNTLQHTGEGGRVRVRSGRGQVCCEVIDGGAAQTFGREMPAADAPRGRGLAIVERICDEVAVATHPDGTGIRVCMRL